MYSTCGHGFLLDSAQNFTHLNQQHNNSLNWATNMKSESNFFSTFLIQVYKEETTTNSSKFLWRKSFNKTKLNLLNKNNEKKNQMFFLSIYFKLCFNSENFALSHFRFRMKNWGRNWMRKRFNRISIYIHCISSFLFKTPHNSASYSVA